MRRRLLIESIWIAETSVPWAAFKAAEYDINIATENGKIPECDKKMVEGITQKLLVRRDSLPLAIPPSAYAHASSDLIWFWFGPG